MARQVNYSGLVVAGIGFFLTRFTVTLAIYEDPIRFFFAGVLPLSLGLGLAAFGVALAVVEVDPDIARTTAMWCVAGAVTMFVLVFLTLLGSTTGGVPDLATLRSRAYLSNFLIGGSVGGTFTGLYAAGNRQHRQHIHRQANRLEVLNRLLRHEILNAVTVIRAYTTVDAAETTYAQSVIADQSGAIERTIEEVKHLTRRRDPSAPPGTDLDLRAALETSLETVADRHGPVELSIETGEPLRVRATARVEQVLVHLLDHAIQRTDRQTPNLSVSATPTTIRVAVTADGWQLSEPERRLLHSGEIERFDDPTTGFGLNLVRLYAEDVGATIETTPDGRTVTVVLPRADREDARPIPVDLSGVRPAAPTLLLTAVAALIAGIVYGAVSEALGGSIAGIGVFYGAASPLVGWITHEFHSVVFGFVFAGLLSVAPRRYRHRFLGHVGIGLAWSAVLWVVAAGVIAPVWLRLLGIPATIPNLTLSLLFSHLAWGTTLGTLTAVGYPRARRLGAWLSGRLPSARP